MTVAPGTMEPASGRWPATVGACSSATVNDHVSAVEPLPARSEARAEIVCTPNPSGVAGRYENRPSTNAPAAETSLPSIETPIVAGSTPIPSSEIWSEMAGVRSAPDEPFFGVGSDKTGAVTSATWNVHSAGVIAFPDRSATVTFTRCAPYARFAPGTSEK